MKNKKEEKQERKVVNLWEKMKQQSQKRWTLAVGFLFLLALLVSFTVPVYYVPLFNNISAKYGLPSDIARKLTLLDLSLSSLGIETQNMVDAFKKQEMKDESSPFYTAYYEEPEGSRLINAKETYYHEFERTRRRPPEVAGVYKDGKTAEIPQISDTVKGVRSLPKGSTFEDMDYTGYGGYSGYSGGQGKSGKQTGNSAQAGSAVKNGKSKLSSDDGYTDFSYKKSTATTASKDEILGTSRRQSRAAYDNRGERIIAGQARPKHDDLPDFASTIYNPVNGQEETLTLTNSPIQKPLVIGEPFTVVKTENAISQLVGGSNFSDTLLSLRNFGTTQGVLGDYVQDDWDKASLFDLFGLSGRDMFLSYFYSYGAIGRKYLESSKHLAEIAFHGDDPQDQVLVARGQKDSKIPVVDLGTPPLVLMMTVKNNLAACDAARKVYEEQMSTLLPVYKEAIKILHDISDGIDPIEGLENVAWRGAPGSCNEYVHVLGYETSLDWGRKTKLLRDLWNNNVEIARDNCKDIRQKSIEYATACKMEYKWDSNEDSCEAIDALELEGGSDWNDTHNGPCRGYVKWKRLDLSSSFDGCGGILPDFPKIRILDLPNNPSSLEVTIQERARENCVTKVEALFKKIDDNVELEGMPGFMFSN